MIRDIKDLEENLNIIPDPTYLFEIGAEVHIGNLENVFINQIYFDGKGYEIDYTNIDHNYGRPIRTEHCRMIVPWMDIRKINSNKESIIKNKDIFISYSQRSMTDIFGKKYYFGIDMNPDYQREYVWELEEEEMKEIKSCVDCKPADIDCQISKSCKKQRRETMPKEIIKKPKGHFEGDLCKKIMSEEGDNSETNKI